MGLVQETRLYDISTNCEKKENSTENDSNSPEEKELEKKELLSTKPKENVDMSLMIIARKEVCRLGARFFSRGIDKDGNVSNFAETEQILRIRQPGKKLIQNWSDINPINHEI
jgi:hypothetical protein